MKHLPISLPQLGLLRKLALSGACAASLLAAATHATPVGTIFYIAMENRNFTSGSDVSAGAGAPLVGSVAAPYINSLINPSSSLSAQVSYCTAYHNVLALPGGTSTANSIHPSEPNYIWFESGSNLSILNDNEPYGSGLSVKAMNTFVAANSATISGQNLSGLIQSAGFSWNAYSEGTNQLNSVGANVNSGGNLTAVSAPQNIWTVPLVSFSGTNATYVNPFSGSTQWNFATKHTGSLFFASTNGTTSLTVGNTTTSNVESSHYPPLTQFASDLANNTVAKFNFITPDQFNDMHTALTAGFNYHGTLFTGDLARIAQGDNFLAIIIPQIMASQAYQNNGVIVIWSDETEGTNQNDFNHTLMEIVISPLAKGNAFASNLNYTHSSDLNTLQKIFQVTAATPTGFLNDAANASNSSGTLSGSAVGFGTGTAFDLSDLFVANTIPTTIPNTQIMASGYTLNRRTNTFTQTVTVKNLLSVATAGPLFLAVDNLSANSSLVGKLGTTATAAPSGSPFVQVASTGLAAGASATITVQYAAPPSGNGPTGSLRVFSGTP